MTYGPKAVVVRTEYGALITNELGMVCGARREVVIATGYAGTVRLDDFGDVDGKVGRKALPHYQAAILAHLRNGCSQGNYNALTAFVAASKRVA